MMEFLGICGAIPVSFGLSLAYLGAIDRAVRRFPGLAPALVVGSALILAMLAVEVSLLISLGAVWSGALLGRPYYLANQVVFFLGVPALANLAVLVIHRFRWSMDGCLWSMLALVCATFGMVLLFLQSFVAAH